MTDPSAAVPPARARVLDVDVAYRRAGDGAPLVYLHGMGLTRRWLPVHAALAERFDVVAPEHPGFGDTARPRWLRGLDDIALIEADLLRTLGLERVHVVGHSLGGVIAAELAALLPERVASLTLIAPGPVPLVTSPALIADGPPPGGTFDDLLFNGNAAAYPAFLEGDDEGLVLAADDGDPHADPDAFALDGSPTLYRRLARLAAPAQILVPDQDRLFDHRIFAQWAEALGGAPLVPIPGTTHPTGHLLIVQEPGAIADAVARLAAGA